ncbi:MAG: hypothetical protein GC201_18820 [Alphaproteobacteria bacterium]|nr:hypothetical protein [Alphaproteobacteria bacterium]
MTAAGAPLSSTVGRILRSALRRLWPLLLAVPLAACGASAPAGRQAVELHSRTMGFIDQVRRPPGGQAQEVKGSLMLPEHRSGRLPAMVMLHGGTGQGTQDWYYARLFNDWGIAVLAVDSFGERGVKDTIFDQSAVSEASIMADAYAALNYLSRRPDIDPSRIGIVGFSKGAAPALLAALERFRKPLARDGNRFALHVAFYPWCGFSFLNETTTGAPILILSGGQDRVTPARLCAGLADRLRRDNPGLRLEMDVYPAGGHAFDYPHPMFHLLGSLPVRGNIPSRCFFAETAPGDFTERSSGLEVTSANVHYALGMCSAPDPEARAIYDPDGARDAVARLHALVGTVLLGVRQPGSTLGASEDDPANRPDQTGNGE